jgi:hypothetical protein
VLVVDDGSVMVGAIRAQLDIEGVPHTDVDLNAGGRPSITTSFLSGGSEGYFESVVLPQSNGASWTSSTAGLSPAEQSDLTAYETAFNVRQVDADELPGPQVGLAPYAGQGSVTWAGALDGLTATVTPSARTSGWGYLSGPVPVLPGTYAILSTPLTAVTTPPLPPGAVFTPFVTVPLAGTSIAGTLMGSYTANGVEQLVTTGAFSAAQQHFRMLAHGIVTWMTRGIHFGYNRNYYSQQFDDAFAYDSRWNSTYHCTPGEDCAASLNVPASDIRMTAGDVDNLVAWQAANGYTPTLAFNGYYSQFDQNGTAWSGTDALTKELVKYKTSLRWLNHGYEHLYQGCQQDFTHVPWTCLTSDGLPARSDGSNIMWTPQTTISSEISQNISTGTTLGLPFDRTEYLSGEHSGLLLQPQQPVDNPSFGAALTANGIRYIGADASREPASRTVGGAITVPRHPVAVYYNVSTAAEEVNEYNWIYLSSSNGGSGYCDANPATATCLAAPLSTATGFTSYIVPTDVANDLHFILSNDPRPFYAHVSNLTGPDHLGLTLMSSILTTYRGAYSSNTPLQNLTLRQAATALSQQNAWASAGMSSSSSISGYVQDGVVTVSNPTATVAPVTAPGGTRIGTATFGSSYGGEASSWISGNATLTPPAPTFTGSTATTLTVGRAASVMITAIGAVSINAAGALPTGVTFVDNANGTATLAGTPAPGTAGVYPVTFTATNAFGSSTRAFTVTVVETPTITSPSSATFRYGTPGSFAITATGSPTPSLALGGTLPLGLVFTQTAAGTATLAGSPVGTARTYTLTVVATSSAGRTTQSLSVVVQRAPAFTSAPTATARVGQASTFTVRTSGYPAPVITATGDLPAGLTFTASTAGGTATLSGNPSGPGGVYPLTLTATNDAGTTTQALIVTVRDAPTFTSASTASVTAGTPFSVTVSASGTPAATISLRSLPLAGVVLTPNSDGTATLSGTLLTPGTRTVLLRATNSAGTAFQTFLLVVG